MTSTDLRRALLVPLLAIACGGGSTKSLGSGGVNVVPISVNGAGCSPNAYFNEPCVSATVCVPGTSTCQTIDHLLLDTGSTGLRVFSQVLTISLPSIPSGGGDLAECVGYLDGSAQWGQVVRASVILGGEPAVTIPIQRIDSTFAAVPTNCAGVIQTDPAGAGFDGILGVGEVPEDCGDGCNQDANGVYFSCVGTTCTSLATPVDSQVANPVAALPLDNNGVVVRLPAVPASGSSSASGELVLGIGTRSNNVPSRTLAAFPLDGSLQLKTSIAGIQSGQAQASFLDTGSNGIFLPSAPDPALTPCGDPNLSGWFCPASPVTVTGKNMGWQDPPSAGVTFTFQIVRIDTLAANVAVSSAVGGLSPGAGVDFGLPFHFGRDVYVVIWGRQSSLGTGPIVAY